MFVQPVLRNNSCQCLFSLSSEIIPVNVYSACPQKSFLSMFIQPVLRNHSCQCLFSMSSEIIPVNVYSACPQKSFPCSEAGGRCIPDTWKCDGHKDCSNGRDEEHCGGLLLCVYIYMYVADRDRETGR